MTESNLSRPRFDLIEAPWIPCETLDGAHVELGIRQTLYRAHELAAVNDESPLVTAVLHRLLLVIVDQAFLPKNREEWLALWAAKELPRGPIDAYLSRWKDRFDLFHAERPFMQVAGLDEILLKDKGKPAERTSMWRMVVEASNCGGHIHVFEREPGAASLPPARAARALLAFMAFTSGGRIQNEADSWKGGNLRSGAVAILRGVSLRETLVLNTCARSVRGAEDVPSWQRDRPIARLVRAAAGPVDTMVWPSRRVLLFPVADAAGAVSVNEVLTAAGERMDADSADPQMAYFERNPKNPPMALRFDPDRSVWRDSAALFDRATGTGAFRRPHAVDQLHGILVDGVLPRNLRWSVDILGMSTDKAVIRLTRAERLPLAPSLLVDPERVGALKQALLLAEGVGQGLNQKVLFVLCERALAPAEREAHKDDIQKLKDALAVMPAFWSALGKEFERWLVDLSETEDCDFVLAEWKHLLRRTTRASFEHACRRLGTEARSLQAIAQADNTLRKMLAEQLPDAPFQSDAAGFSLPQGVIAS